MASCSSYNDLLQEQMEDDMRQRPADRSDDLEQDGTNTPPLQGQLQQPTQHLVYSDNNVPSTSTEVLELPQVTVDSSNLETFTRPFTPTQGNVVREYVDTQHGANEAQDEQEVHTSQEVTQSMESTSSDQMDNPAQEETITVTVTADSTMPVTLPQSTLSEGSISSFRHSPLTNVSISDEPPTTSRSTTEETILLGAKYVLQTGGSSPDEARLVIDEGDQDEDCEEGSGDDGTDVTQQQHQTQRAEGHSYNQQPLGVEFSASPRHSYYPPHYYPPHDANIALPQRVSLQSLQQSQSVTLPITEGIQSSPPVSSSIGSPIINAHPHHQRTGPTLVLRGLSVQHSEANINLETESSEQSTREHYDYQRKAKRPGIRESTETLSEEATSSSVTQTKQAEREMSSRTVQPEHGPSSPSSEKAEWARSSQTIARRKISSPTSISQKTQSAQPLKKQLLMRQRSEATASEHQAGHTERVEARDDNLEIITSQLDHGKHNTDDKSTAQSEQASSQVSSAPGASGEISDNIAHQKPTGNPTGNNRTQQSGIAYWGPHGEPGAQHTWYDARTGSGIAQSQPVSYPALSEPIERAYGGSSGGPGDQYVYGHPHGEPGTQYATSNQQYLARLTAQSEQASSQVSSAPGASGELSDNIAHQQPTGNHTGNNRTQQSQRRRANQIPSVRRSGRRSTAARRQPTRKQPRRHAKDVAMWKLQQLE